jgi:hypothetical protein
MKDKNSKTSVIKITKQYICPLEYDRFKLITVYSDYSVSIGASQKFSDKSLMELKVK